MTRSDHTGATALHVNAFCKLWTLIDGLVEPNGRQSVYIWEPLDVDAPADARPYCYGFGEIDFYDVTGNKQLDRRVRCHLFIAEDLVQVRDGTWFKIASGRCVYRAGRWWMRWLAYKNGRHAKMMNAGWPEYLK